MTNLRSYIRHPSDIPIQIDGIDASQSNLQQHLANVSQGGLAFESASRVEAGSVIRLRITLVQPEFVIQGIVTHCSSEDDHFIIGVEFVRPDDRYVARMVEQICHIEHYRKEIAQQEGRHLTSEQAASEWIAKYAASFPQWTN
jgi:hypothetical protein